MIRTAKKGNIKKWQNEIRPIEKMHFRIVRAYYKSNLQMEGYEMKQIH